MNTIEQQLYSQLKHSSEPLYKLWQQGHVAPAEVNEKLAVLEAHREAKRYTWFDRVGHRAQFLLRRLQQPTRRLRREAHTVLHQHKALKRLDAESLRAEMADISAACRVMKDAEDAQSRRIIHRALAVISVAVEAVHGFVPHLGQIMSAMLLLEGQMAEMATGEGKTLTAAMAAIMAAWRGLPVHVVTSNDYLAGRDAELGEALFHYCGVTVASVLTEAAPPQRISAYNHDVVYTTAQNLLGDYLRDELALGKTPSRSQFSLETARQGGNVSASGVVMQGIYQVIVDEADSVLIDEAVTPLIISMPRPSRMLDDAAHEAVRLARQLQPEQDFKVERALRHVELTADGRQVLESMFPLLSPFWQHAERAEELVQMALYAEHMLKRDQHYVVEDEKIILVDELTGRLAHSRTLSLGMQQILEACEGVPVSDPSEVSARLSFQRFFTLFPRLGGMTGTAHEVRKEFLQAYRLFTQRIPTHRPVQRKQWPVVVCRSEEEKFEAITHSVLMLLHQGRAVLIGMRSVGSSEALYAHMLAKQPGLEASLLHAVNHASESAIVARAGQPGALTIATNMAGRGTDVVLEATVRDQGGLHVIIGESNDFRRIDRQLIGRCARQGDPGSVQRFITLEDELVRRFLPPLLLNGWKGLYASGVGRWGWLCEQLVAIAQWRAERLAFTQRKAVFKQEVGLDRSGL